MNHKYKKLLSDSFLFMISNFASKVLVFLLLPLYTNILSPYEYGIADLMTTTINLLYPILTLSISEAALRFAFDQDIAKKDVLSTSLLLITVGTVLLCFSKGIVRLISAELNEYWFYFCLMYFSMVLQTCFSYYTRGVNKTKLFALQGFIYTIALVVSNIIFLVVINIGLVGYLISIIIAHLASTLFMIIVGKYYKDMFSTHLNVSLLKEMLTYSVPMIPTIIAWWVMQTSDKYMIIWLEGIDISGIYSVAYKIPSVLAIITSLFTQAWQVSAISNYKEVDNAKFISTVYKYYNLVSVIACAALILLSKVLGKLLYSNEFFTAWRYVPILLIAYIFSGLTGFLAAIFTSSKKTSMLLWSSGVGAIFNIVMNLGFIHWFGAMGAAITTLLGFVITWIMRLYWSGKIVPINVDLKKDCMMYLCLIAESVVMCLDLSFKYLVAAALLLLICLIAKREILELKMFAGQLLCAIKEKLLGKAIR